MSVKLSSLLLKTRHNILDVCDDLHIDFDKLDLNKLGVYQCLNCLIWELEKNTVTDPEDGGTLCSFCADQSNFNV